MRFVVSLPSALALALFAGFLAVSLPDALKHADKFLDRAVEHAGETVIEERNRVWGEGFTRTIEEIRRVIPPDGVYVLVNGDMPDRGAPIWVRYELAPRRAILMTRPDLRRPRRVQRRFPREAQWVVVAYDSKLPELIDRRRFLRHVEGRR
jgi:hypothetical protein